jgi:HK97 family phage portal protein
MKLFGIQIPFTRRAAATAPIPDDRYFAVGPWGFMDGARVTPETAIRFTAVLSAVKIISETLASLPVMVYQRRADGGKDRATRHPLYKLLRRRPNSLKTSSFEFREMLTAHVLLWGNGYAQILRNSLDEPVELHPIHPSRVTPKTENERLIYRVRMPDGGERVLAADQVLHIRGYRDSGLEGLSVVAAAEKAIRAGLSLEDFGMNFFEGGAFPSGVLEVEGTGTMSPQAKDNLRESWQKLYGGTNRGKNIAVLEAGLKWKQMMIPQTDAQFLEQRKFQISEVARIFRVPPHMLADLDRATFSNIEHQSQEFITYTMLPWFRRWEEAIDRDLIDGDDEDVFVEFLPDALLRGDTAARATAYRTQIESGILSPNEARLMENRNPYPGGDEFMRPLNMGSPSGQAQEPDEEPDEDDSEEEAVAPPARRGPDAEAINAAFRGLFRETWVRVARKEVNAVRSAAKKKTADEFPEWRQEFLDDLHDFASTCLREPLASYAAVRGWHDSTETLVRFTREYREEVFAALQVCFESPEVGYARSADEVAAYWTERLLGYSGGEYESAA